MDFKAGDLVRLKKLDGPIMTVKSLRHHEAKTNLAALLTEEENPEIEEGERLGILCQWFVKEKLQEGEFAPASLVRAENDEEPTDG